MPVVGYDPAPPGMPGYHFQLDDGSKQYLYGQQADDLARYIDQNKPQGQTAQNPMGFAAPSDSASYGLNAGGVNDPNAGPPVRSDVSPVMAHASPPAPAGNAAPPIAPQLAREAYSQPASTENLPVVGGEAAQPGGEEAGIKSLYRAATMKEALRGKYVPGRAAVDPHALAASGVPVETQETISGGVPETEQERATRLERQSKYLAENEASTAEAKAASAERVAVAEDQRTAALNATIGADIERRDAEKQLLAAKTAADSKWAEIQKENQAAAAQTVDPNRLFHGENGAAVAITSAIAQGLGAFGASLSRSPNYAQQIIQSSIDRDIAAQSDAINRRGAAARNAVADYARTYGLSLEEAKLGVKSTQLKYAGSMAELQASKMGTADAKMKAAMLSIDLNNKAEAAAAELRGMYEGRVQKHFAIVQPQAATRGYFQGPTAESLGKGASTLVATQKAFPEAPKKNEGEVVPNLTRAATAVETGLRALPELQKLSSDAGVTGQVTGKISGLGADTELTVASQHMAYSVASAEVNGMVPDARRVEELTHAFSALNPTTRERNIKMGADILRKKKQSIESVSAKTAKIGTISLGGGEGGAEE